MIRFRGEEMWIGDDHVANLRLVPGATRPVAVQTLDGEICYQALNRRSAELWVNVHALTLIERAAQFSVSSARS